MTLGLKDEPGKDAGANVLSDLGLLEKTLRRINQRLRQEEMVSGSASPTRQLLISASKSAFVCTAELRARHSAKEW
ncbi:MAG: hypothetical protein R3D02_09000 [Hyphomicrobiales bacterium]